jgi:outer membrane scaffolding protein for murein synthesis (MipA/OmpV family)
MLERRRWVAAVALVALAALAAGGSARAEAWIVDAGAAARVRPAHLGSGQYVIDATPIVEAAYGDTLRISLDDGIKWRALRAGQVTVGPIAEYRQSFNDKLPRGAIHPPDALELGGFAEARTPLGIAEARLRRAVNSYEGWSGDLSFSTGAPVTSGLFLGGQTRLSWADSHFTREYFGLESHAAGAAGLASSLNQPYVTVGAEFEAAQRLTPRARLVLDLSADRILGQLRPSPMFQNRDILTAALGLTYRWLGPTTGRLP